jgi:hypothetical protein
VTMTACTWPWSAARYRTRIARRASVPHGLRPLGPKLAAPLGSCQLVVAVAARYPP